jgi:hypothetical protein
MARHKGIIPTALSVDLWMPAYVMPTQVGIHVFEARTVRRGWRAFAHHDGWRAFAHYDGWRAFAHHDDEDHANQSILRAVGITSALGGSQSDRLNELSC